MTFFETELRNGVRLLEPSEKNGPQRLTEPTWASPDTIYSPGSTATNESTTSAPSKGKRESRSRYRAGEAAKKTARALIAGNIEMIGVQAEKFEPTEKLEILTELIRRLDRQRDTAILRMIERLNAQAKENQ